MMETLQNVVNNLKIVISNKIEYDYINQNYGIKSCLDSIYENFNFKKLELIFLNNLCYLSLNQEQLNKILVGNYKNLFKKSTCILNADDVELEKPVIVNNITTNNTINNITNSITEEDTWDQTDW